MGSRANAGVCVSKETILGIFPAVILGAFILALSCCVFGATAAWASDDGIEAPDRAYTAGTLLEETSNVASHDIAKDTIKPGYTGVLSNDDKGLRLDIYSMEYRDGKYTGIGGTCWYRRWGNDTDNEWKADSTGTLSLVPKLVRIEVAPNGVRLPADCMNLFWWDWSGYNLNGAAVTRDRFQSLQIIDCSNMDTSNVQNMSFMFRDKWRLTSLDISGWNTSNVTNMYGMFDGCSQLSSLNLANWNTSKVTNMSWMFSGCKALTSLNVGNWNTSRVKDMLGMFDRCSKLKSLNISKWKTAKVKDSSYMFNGCTALKRVYLPVANPYKPQAAKKAFVLRWNRPANTSSKMVDGYQVRYSLKSTMKQAKMKTVATAKKSCKLKVGKLKPGKRYYVQIRTYKKVDNKKYYSNWSKAKAVRVKR